MIDAARVDDLLSEWFDWKPISGRLESVHRAVRKKELLVAEAGSRVVGFIHYVLHEDIIDGGSNAFISAFYVSEAERGKRNGNISSREGRLATHSREALSVWRPRRYTCVQRSFTKSIISSRQWEILAKSSSNLT
jgi:GNAT superfamily N-acetyltransferase